MSSDVAAARKPAAGALIPVATAAIFASACLLFAVQPLFAKLTLPLLGGSPAVWTTALAFYQAALVAGYLYADALQRQKRLAVQAGVHGVVLVVAALLALPLAVSDLLGPPPPGAPVAWLLGVFAVSVGPPFIALAATAPLVQAWVARAAPDRDPYPLYAASNLGSFLALLAYPLAVEPLLGGRETSLGWSVGFALAGVLILAAGLLSARSSAAAAEPEVLTPERKTTWAERAIWAGCAAGPSLLLAAVTAHVTTDVAAMPLLWAVPLALYLLTFVIAFSARPFLSAEAMLYARVFAVFTVAVLQASDVWLDWGGELVVHILVFFVVTLACHLELARRRPEPARLTEFYLWMSIGGALGGAFAGLVAPQIFARIYEYPLALALCLLIAPWGRAQVSAAMLFTAGAMAVAACGALAFLKLSQDWAPSPAIAIAVIAMGFAALWVRAWPPAAAGLAGLAFLADPIASPPSGAAYEARSFFGVHRVRDYAMWRLLTHGTTLHGVKNTLPGRDREPVTYYHVGTPLGGTLARLRSTPGAKIGVVGLGAGGTACHAVSGQDWTYFEIDPAVVKIAQDPALFGFLGNCAPDARIVLGDARLTLADEPDGAYDLLLIDAFSSATIPAHLLTKEAIELYLSKLKPDGAVLLHISNRNMSLIDPLADIAEAVGAPARLAEHVPLEPANPDDPAEMYTDSTVTAVLMARDERGLLRFIATADWTRMDPPGERVWTDDYQNVLGAILKQMQGQ